jgi:hypothetical protein
MSWPGSGPGGPRAPRWPRATTPTFCASTTGAGWRCPVTMNVNDVICVGADPIAVLDYIAVERADPEALEQIARGLRTGAEEAGVEIPGGELAVLPELIRGHPSPHSGSCWRPTSRCAAWRTSPATASSTCCASRPRWAT